MATMADQAVEGIEITFRNGLVLVNDGADRWLCNGHGWQAALDKLDEEPAIDGDEGGAEAYGRLCSAVTGPVASRIGTSRGEWKNLVGEAFTAELIDADDARAYGVEVQP